MARMCIQVRFDMKPLLRALSGEAVWPPPIWLMRQAGRYLPEYKVVRAKVPDFIALCTTPDLAAEVTLQPIRRFAFDGAILFSDILIIPWALGRGLEYRDGEGPVLPPLRDTADMKSLSLQRAADAVQPVMETVRQARSRLAAERFDDTALIGFAGAPFTVACYMVEGGGSRDFAATRGMAYRDPRLFSQLIDLLTQATIAYLAAQADAGAEALMLFDSWSGILSPQMFRSHVIAPTRQIVAALRLRFPNLPIIGFPRLAGMLFGEYAGATGIQAAAMDTGIDPQLAIGQVPASVTLQGNLDPMAVVAGGASMAEAVSPLLEAMGGHPFVFNLGHGIMPQTPPEHVGDLVRLVRGT
jgi:uroporphyrinogen decarboxylase